MAQLERPETRYGNLFSVGYNTAEFLVEISQTHDREIPGAPHTRIIMAPLYAKEFALLLSEQIANFEQQHGTIHTRPDEDEGN
jgi:hypothetical protein